MPIQILNAHAPVALTLQLSEVIKFFFIIKTGLSLMFGSGGHLGLALGKV